MHCLFCCRKRKLDETPSSDVPSKKVKTENGKSEKDKTEEALRKQNKELYKNRDLLETNYKKREWLQILNTNKQTVPDDCEPKFVSTKREANGNIVKKTG